MNTGTSHGDRKFGNDLFSMPLYLGLDAGALGLTATVIEVSPDTRRIVFSRTLNFDRDLPEYGTTGGMLRTSDGDAAPSPLMWADALDRLLGRLAAAAEIAVEEIRAISGSAPLDSRATFDYRADFDPTRLEPSSGLARQLRTSVGPSGSLSGWLESLLRGSGDRLGSYWQRRYALPDAAIVPWTDDRATRTIGMGLIHDHVLGVTFGTSDVISTNNVVLSFRNGSLARDWVRMEHRLEWDDVAQMLEQSPGNDGRVMLPWLEREMTPPIAHAGVRRFGFDRNDAQANVRGMIEGQLMAMANHMHTLGAVAFERVIATGGAAVNRAILQVMANVFGVEVYRLDAEDAAALGAALRAYHADRLAAGEPVSWRTVVSGFTDPKPGHRVSPNPRHVAMYAALRADYALLERLHQDRAAIC